MAFRDALRGVESIVGRSENTHFDDLIVGAVTGPQSGTRLPFRYREILPKHIKKRLGENRYLGVDGVEYQDNGRDDWTYNVDCFFEGRTHPTDAAAFVEVLLEQATPGNPLILEHPRDKVQEVVVESIRVVHDPNRNANQTTVSVVFHDQLTLPADRRDRPAIAVEYALESFVEEAKREFGAVALLNSVRDRVATAREVVSQINVITETTGSILDASSQILSDFNAIKQDILNNIDTLLNFPEVLAANIVRLVDAVLSIPGDLFNKSDGLERLYKTSLGIDDDSIPTLFGAAPDSVTRNVANVQALVASTAAAAMLVNVVQNTGSFLTKQAAYESSTRALAAVRTVTAALEAPQDAYVGKTVQDRYFTPSTLQQLQVLKRICYASTQQLTSSLPATRIIRLEKDTSILQVAFDYYDEDISDDRLWAIAETNNLSIEEMIVIPAGRELYV